MIGSILDPIIFWSRPALAGLAGFDFCTVQKLPRSREMVAPRPP